MKEIHWLFMLMLLYLPAFCASQHLVPSSSIRNRINNYHSEDEDDDQPLVTGDNDPEEEIPRNATSNINDEKGLFVGASCEFTCSYRLQHVFCNPISTKCECEKKYPVKLHNPYSGCSKPKKLGEQCYYHESCEYSDQHATCMQVHHNAVCQCQNGYHTVTIQKSSRKVFCAEDIQVMKKDFSTFAGVLSGIAVLSGLICFVLHLFNQTLYGSGHHRRHRFGNANLAPPILFSSSDPGSRRPSIASVHSASSMRSYSAKRYEKEREQKEEREMQRRLSKMNSSMSVGRLPQQPTPSPHSTDDLLPTLEEDQQTAYNATLGGFINTSYAL